MYPSRPLRGLATIASEREHPGRGNDEDIVLVRFTRDRAEKRKMKKWGLQLRGFPILHLSLFPLRGGGEESSDELWPGIDGISE